ncbi:MAG TPA: hypothetical protein VLN45_05895 [Ignavibacteriaceae bacterium]|nr:hypothetical protein [Ignavibacteriaceae bacterium]
MATKIKIVTTGDFLEITPEGIINYDTSKQLLLDIARSDNQPEDYDLLIDFRDTKWKMSTLELYQLAGKLLQYGNTFRGKVALLVFPGTAFDAASFLETCSHNNGFFLDAFSDYESAMRWLLSSEKNLSIPLGKADSNDGLLPF